MWTYWSSASPRRFPWFPWLIAGRFFLFRLRSCALKSSLKPSSKHPTLCGMRQSDRTWHPHRIPPPAPPSLCLALPLALSPSVCPDGDVVLFPLRPENILDHEIELVGPDLPVVVRVVHVETQTNGAGVAVTACSSGAFGSQHPRIREGGHCGEVLNSNISGMFTPLATTR